MSAIKELRKEKKLTQQQIGLVMFLMLLYLMMAEWRASFAIRIIMKQKRVCSSL